MFKAESYLGYKLCWPGDLVINSLWAWGGGLGVSLYHGIISSAYGVYRIRDGLPVKPAFIHELVRSAPFNWELKVRSKGIWISRLQLTDESFLDAPFPLPPRDEQDAIVRFLTNADQHISAVIRAKRQLIGLLNEQKQTIIHPAITRGLVSNVSLKSSGIPLLGDIPRHWNALQIRRLVSFVTSGSRGWAEYYSDDGDIFLQSGNLGRNMALNLAYVQHVRPPNGSEGQRTKVQQNDVLICITGAMTGNVAIIDNELNAPTYVNQHVGLVRPRADRIWPRFLAYALHSRVGKSQFKTSEYGGTKQGLGLNDVKSIFVPVPPRDEQQAICSELDRRLAKVQTAIARAEREIELIREYRTRLVADVVTGQLDVRAAAANLPTEIQVPEAAMVTEPEEDEAMDKDVTEPSGELA